jgi:YD repeat-containing protein
MKIFYVVLLVLIVSITCSAQKMTDRDLDRLAGKVKVVEVWRQKISADGTPLEEGKTVSETTYDEEGNISTKIDYGAGKLKTTYFLVKGERVSKSEWIGEDPTAKMTLPKGITLQKKKNGPFDVTYKYKYEKNGRIAEISWNDVEGRFGARVKYVFDDSGRIVSSKNQSGWNVTSEWSQSFKYDDKGNVTEALSKSTVHVLKGIGSNTSGEPYAATEKDESSVRYSDYHFDKDGNWINRRATGFNSKGKITSLEVEVRVLTYF